MEKLKLHTPDLLADNIAKLSNLFPNCVAEVRDETGRVTRAIDFDQLRQELSDHVVEGARERYHLDWPGKREALLAANSPIAKTLRPWREGSINFDTARHLLIEGDNLDVLKLLQETYLNRVRLIYIDPPYNTGRDFIYDDNFADTSDSYFQRSQQRDDEGNRLIANTEANGRFHSDWLSMLYPRLRLARNLLHSDGVVFISIDDNEYHNLRKLCDEVFGDENFIATIIWQKVFSPKNTARHFSVDHDYVVVYAKNAEQWRPQLLERTAEQDALYSNPDGDPRGPWTSSDLTARNYYADGMYEFKGPTGKLFSPGKGRYWGSSLEKLKQLNADNRIWWGPDGDKMPRLKRFLSEVTEGRVPQTFWSYKEVGHTQDAKKELLKYVPFSETENVLNSVKPVKLIQRILHLAGPSEDMIVLDFFSGSGTTAHAVIKQNAEDGGTRRFVCVQVAEPLPVPEKELTTIFEMGRIRVKNVISELDAPLTHERDLGFRAFKVDSSNMKDVYYVPDGVRQGDLLDQIENIKEDRTPEDLLFQVLLDWGVDLSLPIAQETIDGKTIFFVDQNALAACFDRDISEELVKKIAARKPLRVVFRDAGFSSDAVKINVEQIFKLASPGTEVKAI